MSPVTAANVIIKNVVALQNYGSSGTLFLQSLLDNHPNILMTPALYSQRFYYFWDEHAHLGTPDLADAFMDYHAYWFRPDGAPAEHGLRRLGPQQNQSVHAPPDAFRELLLENLSAQGELSRRSFFIATYLAYAGANDREVQSPATILYPIHSGPQQHALYLVGDFPEARFLYTVRQPIQDIGSLTRHILYNRLPVSPLECAFAQLLNDYMKHWGRSSARRVMGDRPFFPEYAELTRAVRLEDLHKRPKDTLEAVCRWIGIPWDHRLLESTFDGKQWWNRPESPTVSGFGSQTIGQAHGDLIGRFDRVRLNGLLRGKHETWDYPVPGYARNRFFQLLMPLLLLLPFKAEVRTVLDRVRNAAASWRRSIPGVAGRLLDRLRLPRPPKNRLTLALVAAVSPALVLLIPALVVRDYVMVRWWLYRAWIADLSGNRPEVRLLSIGAEDG